MGTVSGRARQPGVCLSPPTRPGALAPVAACALNGPLSPSVCKSSCPRRQGKASVAMAERDQPFLSAARRRRLIPLQTQDAVVRCSEGVACLVARSRTRFLLTRNPGSRSDKRPLSRVGKATPRFFFTSCVLPTGEPLNCQPVCCSLLFWSCLAAPAASFSLLPEAPAAWQDPSRRWPGSATDPL